MSRDREDMLPIRESMRKHSHKYGYDVKVFDHGIQNYKIVGRCIDNCLKKSIGKNYDKVRKQILEKMKYNQKARHEANIVDSLLSTRFHNSYGEYCIDSQGRIQINKSNISWRKTYSDRRKKARTTVILDSSRTFKLKPSLTPSQLNRLEALLLDDGIALGKWFTDLCGGGSILEEEYNRKFKVGRGYRGWTPLKNQAEILSYFIVDKDIQTMVYEDNSAEYKKWKKESIDSEKKKLREAKRKNNEKLETLLHDIETAKKAKELAKDIIDRDRLGFDEESFKGEFYHGQKRKK